MLISLSTNIYIPQPKSEAFILLRCVVSENIILTNTFMSSLFLRSDESAHTAANPCFEIIAFEVGTVL